MPSPITPEAVLLSNTPPVDHDPRFSIFDQLDGDLIRRVVLRSSGAAGPLELTPMDGDVFVLRSAPPPICVMLWLVLLVASVSHMFIPLVYLLS